MKKMLMLALCATMTGCLTTQPVKKPADTKAADVAAEKKLAERFPLVDPGSINAQNALSKANDELAGIEREKKRLAAASAPNNSQVK